jgi:hypothetical protein
MVAVYNQDDVMQAPPADHSGLPGELALRLERGLGLIEARKADGLSVDRHEDHWIALLKEYEAAYDNLQ